MERPQRPPASESSTSAIPTRFQRLGIRFRPFPVVMTALTIALMVGLCLHIAERFRAMQLRSYSQIAEVYVTQFLGPYARSLIAGGSATATDLPTGEIETTLARLKETDPAIVLQIWSIEGALLYASAPGAVVEDHDGDDLLQAKSGTAVARIEVSDQSNLGGPLPAPYLEIYIPIRADGSGQIIAVGELYVDAVQILEEIHAFNRTLVLAVGLATLGVLAMLAASARQAETLRSLLAAEQQLSQQNRALHLAAEEARVSASKVNEATLNLLGAEIHDGPVQLLGLAALMSPKPVSASTPDKITQSELIGRSVEQLRKLSAGLILPELDGLDANAVARLVVSRHQELLDAPADIDSAVDGLWLDMPRRICLYRVIQEGLMNAARHGDGQSIRIQLRSTPSTLTVAVHNSPGAVGPDHDDDPSSKLGLRGMRLRLSEFGGTAVLRNVGDVTVLFVTLPLPSGTTGAHAEGLA